MTSFGDREAEAHRWSEAGPAPGGTAMNSITHRSTEPGQLQNSEDCGQRMLVVKLGLTLMLGTMTVTSCSDPAGVQATVRYDLTLINEATLPAEIAPFNTILYTILDGSIVLVSDGTCRRTVRVRGPVDPLSTDLAESEGSWGCTWTQNGSTLSFTWVDAEGNTPFPFLGTVVSSTIQQGRITMTFHIGWHCIRAPCPSGRWNEVYEEVPEL